jgi:lia operon protein LiaF
MDEGEQRMRTSVIFGMLLIVSGIAYGLHQLHLITLAPSIFSTQMILPVILFLVGLSGLKRHRQGKFPLWSIFFVTWGMILGVKVSGYVTGLAQMNGWGIFAGLFLVFLGLSLLLPSRLVKGPRVMVISDKNRRKMEWTFQDFKDTADNGEGIGQERRHWVGDLSVGGQPWALKDMSLFNGIGDVRVNFTTAHVEDGLYRLRVDAWIGDVRILVPESVKLRVDAKVGIGDVLVFNDSATGTGRAIAYQDPDYEQASKRIDLSVDLKIGDIQIVRV